VSKNRKAREKSKVTRLPYKIIALGPRKKGVRVSCQIGPTDESWNHFHSFLNANTINLCGLHANIFLCKLMLTICSNVWHVNTVLPFLTTFLAISQKINVQIEKKTREIYYSLVFWSIFVDAKKTSKLRRQSTRFSCFTAVRFCVRPHIFYSF
jgi:hypothetical protein